MDSKAIGIRIKRTRENADMSLNDVAQKMGLNKSTIMRYESGEVAKIKMPILDKLAEVLNVSPHYLLGWSQEPQRSENIHISLSPIEKEMVIAYRKNKPMQEAVRRLLGVEE